MTWIKPARAGNMYIFSTSSIKDQVEHRRNRRLCCGSQHSSRSQPRLCAYRNQMYRRYCTCKEQRKMRKPVPGSCWILMCALSSSVPCPRHTLQVLIQACRTPAALPCEFVFWNSYKKLRKPHGTPMLECFTASRLFSYPDTPACALGHTNKCCRCTEMCLPPRRGLF